MDEIDFNCAGLSVKFVRVVLHIICIDHCTPRFALYIGKEFGFASPLTSSQIGADKVLWQHSPGVGIEPRATGKKNRAIFKGIDSRFVGTGNGGRSGPWR